MHHQLSRLASHSPRHSTPSLAITSYDRKNNHVASHTRWTDHIPVTALFMQFTGVSSTASDKPRTTTSVHFRPQARHLPRTLTDYYSNSNHWTFWDASAQQGLQPIHMNKAREGCRSAFDTMSRSRTTVSLSPHPSHLQTSSS